MPKGLRACELRFNDALLTHFGGMVLIHRFCKQLRVRWLLQKYLTVPRRPDDYAPTDVVMAMLYAIIAGLRRINKTDILQYNGTFLSLLGLHGFPDQTTLRRFLKRLSAASIRQIVGLHDQLRQRLLCVPHVPTTLIFDLDSVVLTLYGKQQFARIGYNPKKHGRRSYHPLLCFEERRQEFWHATLRPGDAGVNTGAIAFLRRCLTKTPYSIARRRIRVRADAGFFSGRLFDFLEQQGLGYVVVARQHPGIRAQAQAARFHALRHGWAVGQFTYGAPKWKHPRRFIVVRRPLPEDPAEAAQLKLFADQRYAYAVLVTNLRLAPWRVWRFYCPRATVEKHIRELLYDLPLGKIPTDAWMANVAFFHLVLFAYDLVHWFKRLCLPPEYLHATLETVRTDLLVLPARLVRRGGRNILQLPRDYHHRDMFMAAYKKAGRVRFPPKS